MAICTFDSDYIGSGYTFVDNLFLRSYLPQADPIDVTVYLYGLSLAGNEGGDANHTEQIGLSLRLSPERVQTAFRYWESVGLVTVCGTKITYRSVKKPLTSVVKLNAAEYADFVEECTRIFPDKTLSENELLALIEGMREGKMEAPAMLMVMKYCQDSRASASVPYVLAVARDWAQKGIRTLSEVENHIGDLENNREEIRGIFLALGKKSTPALDDRILYLKWTGEYGYSLDIILTAARSLKKKGGMERLDRILEELKNADVQTAEEADRFLRERQARFDLAEEIVRKLGGSYGNYESAVAMFLQPWMQMGFDRAALLQIASFCFVKNIRSLESMGLMVKDFYRLGLTAAPAIVAYVDEQIKVDELIREVLSAAGASPYISPKDRESYRTFVGEWGFDHEAILAVAEATAGRPFPFQRLNKLLSAAKAMGITEKDELKAFAEKQPADAPKKKAKELDYMQHDYTAEQLNSLFHAFDDLEDK